MARRISFLVFLVAVVSFAGCSSSPTGPGASPIVLRDMDDPECVDTVYEPASAAAPAARNSEDGSATQPSSSTSCHVVIVHY